MSDLISERLAAEEKGKLYCSFEFYPPRSEEAEQKLLKEDMPRFLQQSPVFLDLTWGAGGSTSETTMRLSKTFQELGSGVPVNMHITCTNMPKGLIREALEFAKENNIRNIVALRGDPPRGESFQANPDGFHCALDLIKFIRQNYGDYFSISAAGYPEGHPGKLDAEGKITEEDYKKELIYLKEKVDAGAKVIITQLFYDANIFIKFVKECRAMGITVPILPGLLPVTRYTSLQRMVELCKTYLPPDMKAKVEALKDDAEALKEYGVQQCVEMIRQIQQADIGANHFHFYTINECEQTFNVMKELGLYKEC